MAIDVIDTIKPKSDFHVAEAPDIDMKGKRLDKVVEKLQENIKSIDENIGVISAEQIASLT